MVEFAEAKEAIDALLAEHRGRGLTNVERDILQGTWEDQQYGEMGLRFNRSSAALKQTASQLWQCLTQVLQTRVSKSNFRSVIETYLQRRQRSNPNPARSATAAAVPAPDSATASRQPAPLSDLGGLDCDLPDFGGREADLQELMDKIQSGCRLISVTGTSGIGKTWLIGELVNRLGKQFDYLFYRRISDMPTLAALYTEFSPPIDPPSPNGASSPNAADAVRAMMQALRQQQCLLILDQTEHLCESNQVAGIFSRTNADYMLLLERIVEERHRSCLILVGREQLTRLSIFSGRAYFCQLNGLPLAAAKELLPKPHRLNGTKEEQRQLIEFYGGHPQLLLIAADYIDRFHNGEISEFLPPARPLPNQLTGILAEMLERLTEPETALLYWFVLQPLTLPALLDQVPPRLLPPQINSAWDSLIRRLILVKPANEPFWELHPPVLAVYVAQRFVDCLLQELLNQAPTLLHRYPLLIATAPVYQQEQQRDRVLAPLAAALQRACHHEATIAAKLKKMLEHIRETTGAAPSYAAGNLLTLAGQLNVALTGSDFSGLDIRQADLRYIQLHNVSCLNCSFRDTLFATGLSDRLVTALHPDGGDWAVGDATGRLVRWRRVDEQAQFVSYCRLEQAVELIAFGADDLLAVATANHQIRLWWNPQIGSAPVELGRTPTVIRSLCISPENQYLAAGLADGRIMVWDLQSETLLPVLRSHTAAVLQLVFSPDGRQLASCGDDNRVLLWAIGAPTSVPALPSGRYHTFLTLAWGQGDLQIGEGHPNSIQVRAIDGTPRPLPGHQGIALSLAFSADARYLVSSSSDDAVRLWNLDTEAITVLTGFAAPPVLLALSRNGRILLTNSRSQVELWDAVKQRCLWSLRAFAGEQMYAGLNLQGATGVLPNAQVMLADLGARHGSTST